MTNYPLPPTPPGPFGPQYGVFPPGASHALAPARRAAIMLWFVGGLGMMCGLCVVGALSLVPHDQLVQAMHNSMANQPNDLFSQIPVDTLILQGKVQATLVLVFAATMVASAFGVYRAKRPAIIVALIPCVLVLLACGLNALFSVLLLAKGAAASAILNFMMIAFIAAIFGVTVRWLIQAFSVSAKAAEEQLRQMQYWYHQQQHQQPTGYGYGPPQSPPASPAPQTWIAPPPPPPPPAPPSPPNGTDDEPKA